MSGSKSTSSQASTTNNVNRAITTGSGNILNLSDNTLGEGATVNVETSDPEVLLAALGTTERLAAGSNALAEKATEATTKFVEVASGNKVALYTVAGVGLVGGLLALAAMTKKKGSA